MKKHALLILVLMLAVTGLVVTGVHAWNSSDSDVVSPAVSPQSGEVRYRVVGGSMSPTLKGGDAVLVDTQVKNVESGDIVIFRNPKDTSDLFCRRVVAVSGDKVVMKYYSNVKITTVYGASGQKNLVFPTGVVPNGNAYGAFDTTVNANGFYVVGDNTTPGASTDSDQLGVIPRANIIGVVVQRIAPNPRVF